MRHIPPRAWLGCIIALGVAGFAQAYERDPINHYILDCADGCPQKALEAAIGAPSGITMDAEGNVYFTSQNIAFKLLRDGTLIRIAGTGIAGYSGDGGSALNARLNIPSRFFDNGDWVWYAVGGGIAVDPEGNVVIADGGNGRLRRIDRSGTIDTLEDDTGVPIGNGFDILNGVAVDASGNLVFGSVFGALLRRSSDGRVEVLEECMVESESDGWVCGTQLVAIDAAGIAYFADMHCRMRRWDPVNGLVTIAGASPIACGRKGDDGPALDARLGTPFGVAVDATGQVYFTDIYYHCVRMIDAAGILRTVAGSCGYVSAPVGTTYIDIPFGGDGGQATDARLFGPRGIAVDRDGNLYIADTGHRRIRKVTPDGIITTVAGNGDPLPVTKADAYRKPQ